MYDDTHETRETWSAKGWTDTELTEQDKACLGLRSDLPDHSQDGLAMALIVTLASFLGGGLLVFTIAKTAFGILF